MQQEVQLPHQHQDFQMLTMKSQYISLAEIEVVGRVYPMGKLGNYHVEGEVKHFVKEVNARRNGIKLVTINMR
jgi:hypothetical protein